MGGRVPGHPVMVPWVSCMSIKGGGLVFVWSECMCTRKEALLWDTTSAMKHSVLSPCVLHACAMQLYSTGVSPVMGRFLVAILTYETFGLSRFFKSYGDICWASRSLFLLDELSMYKRETAIWFLLAKSVSWNPLEFSEDLAGKFNLLHTRRMPALDRRQTDKQTDKLTTVTLANAPSVNKRLWRQTDCQTAKILCMVTL